MSSLDRHGTGRCHSVVADNNNLWWLIKIQGNMVDPNGIESILWYYRMALKETSKQVGTDFWPCYYILP
jgi:hypothetical protein